MDVEQYKMFLAVANCGSISEAARQLNIAQPALSVKMKKMSEECGAMLFEKKKGIHGVSLTVAGNLVYNKAQEICSLENELKAEIKDYNEGLCGTLKLALFPWENEFMIYKAIKGFHKLYPDVKFEIFQKNKEVFFNANFEYELDILSKEQFINYEKTRVIIASGPCPIYVVVSKNNDIIPNRCSCVRLADLDNVPLIIPMCNQGKAFIAQLYHSKLRTNVIGYSHYRSGGLYMARASLGAAVVFRNDDSKFYPDLNFLKLEDSHLIYRYVVSTKPGQEISKLLRKFIEYKNNLHE